MRRLIFLSLLVAMPLLALDFSTSVGVLGLGVWWLRLFLLSTRLQIRLLLSTPLCLCWLWLAWLGVASWLAPMVVAIEIQ